MRVTQFQGHLPESRKVTSNTVGKGCGSVAWADLQECVYSYRGTWASVAKRFFS